MKIVITSLTGNAGKTTLRKHMLVPLLTGARSVSIEDVNDGDGPADAELAAREFRQLAVELNTADDAANFVIDIGSSNLREMLVHLRSLRTTREDIDCWVLPCCPTLKQRNDTLATIKALIDIGVPSSRIRVVPSDVQDLAACVEVFDPLRDAASKVGYQVSSVPVLHNDVFQMLKDRSNTVFDVAADATDFKALARLHRADPKALEDIGKAMVIRDLAVDASHNLRGAFASLGLPELTPA